MGIPQRPKVLKPKSRTTDREELAGGAQGQKGRSFHGPGKKSWPRLGNQHYEKTPQAPYSFKKR